MDVHCEVGKSERQRAVGDNHKCEATLYFADASSGVRGERIHVSESADHMVRFLAFASDLASLAKTSASLCRWTFSPRSTRRC